MTPREVLDDFAKEYIVASRDTAIFWIDAWLNTEDKPPNAGTAPRVKAKIAEDIRLSKLPPDVKQMVRGLAIRAVDEVIHALLLNLTDLSYDETCKLVYHGVDVLRVTPEGLHGWQFLDDGWFARFSKYGEHPHTPAALKDKADST